MRSYAGAAALAAFGVRAWRGTLDDVEGLRDAVAAADGVIHTAFDYDFSRYAANCQQDRRAIEALGAALKGSNRPLIVTSGMVLDVQGRPATEADVTFPLSPAYPRASEHVASALVARGVNASVVRLPPSVHGEGDHGLVPMMIGFARTKGWRRLSTMAPTAGRRCIAWTLRACFVWRSSAPPRARAITPWPRRASRSATSQR